MSEVIEDGLVYFRKKLNRHLKIVNDCYAEIARLEALQREGNPTTGAVDGAWSLAHCPDHKITYNPKLGCPACPPRN